MVKFYESAYSYDYSFPAVTLAYFLRYPNPYSTHVLSTDVISREIDAAGRLHTVRVHRKSSRLPPAILKLLPKSVLGSTARTGRSESYILETSTIDVKEGWMRTESKNLDWTGILSVVEKQQYKRHIPMDEGDDFSVGIGTTGVVTTVMFRSRFGERLRRARKDEMTNADTEDEHKKSFLATWTNGSLQRSIEAIASRKTENQLGKSKEGMMVVLERMRSGGLVGVLEGMRRDRELLMGGEAMKG
jgi:hypothetical protein